MTIINGPGLCLCGCGEPAPLGKENRPSRGLKRGQPLRFISGHSSTPFRPDRPKWTVDPDTGCWLWTGYLTHDGYGVSASRRWGYLAHRANYRRHVGPIPAGFDVDHLCRVRRCVNPDHLEAVTHEENVRRAADVRYAETRRLRAGGVA